MHAHQAATAARAPLGPRLSGAGAIALACCLLCGPARAAAEAPIEEVVVTAERLGLIGTATTASEGVVVNDELALAPTYRPGQLLETVPGLDVTAHSGEGKANQYLLRGYNLDHGTDLGISVDDMPVNEPTHAHGQGYADLNFLLPELATNIHYAKGTYYAPEGDFSSVGAVHIGYLNTAAPELTATAGTLGYEQLAGMGSRSAGTGNLLGALELQHYDGPWDRPDDQRKINTALRFSAGDERNGYSLTAMLYHGLWNSSTDQPQRALTQGLIDRYGSLNPTDGGRAQRASLSSHYAASWAGGQLSAGAYVINNQLTLWNDFTHFLVDPAQGDQEAQHENRMTYGGAFSYARTDHPLGLVNDWIVGLQARFDVLDVARLPTQDRQPLPAALAAAGFSESDTVHLGAAGVYLQTTTHWRSWLRTVIGLRADAQSGRDAGTNRGSASAALFEPKGSLIFTPTDSTEFYLSAGRGFHSDDLRGVNQAQAAGTGGAPLLAKQVGQELGIRQQFTARIAITVALFNLNAQSETTYNPDIGQDEAGPASQRRGFEVNLTYQVRRWLELYGSYSADHARFTASFDDGTGHSGEYLPTAPFATGSLTAYVKNLGHWSGGLEYRYLGAFPLSADNVVQGHGYGEWNVDAHYALPAGWSLGLGVYNALDALADAAEFWYVDRLPGEPPTGVADLHRHPLEPRSARLTVSRQF